MPEGWACDDGGVSANANASATAATNARPWRRARETPRARGAVLNMVKRWAPRRPRQCAAPPDALCGCTTDTFQDPVQAEVRQPLVPCPGSSGEMAVVEQLVEAFAHHAWGMPSPP